MHNHHQNTGYLQIFCRRINSLQVLLDPIRGHHHFKQAELNNNINEKIVCCKCRCCVDLLPRCQGFLGASFSAPRLIRISTLHIQTLKSSVSCARVGLHSMRPHPILSKSIITGLDRISWREPLNSRSKNNRQTLLGLSSLCEGWTAAFTRDRKARCGGDLEQAAGGPRTASVG